MCHGHKCYQHLFIAWVLIASTLPSSTRLSIIDPLIAILKNYRTGDLCVPAIWLSFYRTYGENTGYNTYSISKDLRGGRIHPSINQQIFLLFVPPLRKIFLGNFQYFLRLMIGVRYPAFTSYLKSISLFNSIVFWKCKNTADAVSMFLIELVGIEPTTQGL